jgi:hypothetical protein
LWAVHQIDPRHRKAGTLRQFAHDRHQFRRAALVDLLGTVDRQDELVGIPVTEQISPGGDNERDQGAAAPADQIPDRHKQTGQAGKQDGGTHIVHRSPSLRRVAEP